ncbi:MAG: cation:proton antiporter [Pseudomonadota bacterium]
MEHHSGIELSIFAIAVCIVVFSLLTKLINRSVFTLPMVFTAIGYTVSMPTMSLASAETLNSAIRFIAEVTLILVLFSDASQVRFAKLKESYALPLRMLLVGMPLSIAFGTLALVLINPWSILPVALLTAAVLTPTDAALGQTVVTSPKVPLHLRQTINVESGLNDGLALPFVLIAAILSAGGMGVEELPALIAWQIVLGPFAGIVAGWCVAKLLEQADARDLVAESARGVVFLTTAFIAFLGAELIGGNGFIAAFVAGAVFGNSYRNDLHFITEFMEGNGQLLTMIAFITFGALLLPDGIAHLSAVSFLAGISFLTVVRIVPILVSLVGTGLPMRERLFLGWFGPRGLASILFTLIVVDEYQFPGETEMIACVSATVLFSIVLHGISATSLAKRIGKPRLP